MTDPQAMEKEREILAVLVVIVIAAIVWRVHINETAIYEAKQSRAVNDAPSYQPTSARATSSGRICTYIRPLSDNPSHLRTSIASSNMGCPSGETCTKSPRDVDGDGLLCVTIPASDGALMVCDGICK